MSGKSLSDRLDDLEIRIRACERFDSWAIGGGTMMGFLLGVAVPVLLWAAAR